MGQNFGRWEKDAY